MESMNLCNITNRHKPRRQASANSVLPTSSTSALTCGISRALRNVLLLIAVCFMFTVVAIRTSNRINQTMVRAMNISWEEPSNRYDHRNRGTFEATAEDREFQLLSMNKGNYVGMHTDSGAPTVDIEVVEKDVENARSNSYRDLFPNTTSRFVAGMKFIPRKAFFNKFNVGYPVDKDTAGNKEVLLLYQSEGALPSTSEVGAPNEPMKT